MPTQLWHRSVDMDRLYSPFLEAVLALQAECVASGYSYKVYSGHRPFDEQQALYEAHLKGAPRAAPPGLSAHNYGLAVDCARLLPDGKLSWDAYEVLEMLVSKHGLVTGKSFGDRPHLQWPGYVSGAQLRPLKVIYEAASGTELDKLKAVWQTL